MRLIDADELLDHAGRDKLDSRELIFEMINNAKTITNKLHWITPNEDAQKLQRKLYLAYVPGYPLFVADWRTGHGYRNVATGEHIEPDLIAVINAPSHYEEMTL